MIHPFKFDKLGSDPETPYPSVNRVLPCPHPRRTAFKSTIHERIVAGLLYIYIQYIWNLQYTVYMTNRFMRTIINCPSFPKATAPFLCGQVNPIHLRCLLFSFCQGSVNIALAARQFRLQSQWKILKHVFFSYGFWVSLFPAQVRKYIEYESILS